MAIERLEREYDKPWFLAVGFTKPHLSWIAPRKYFEMYDPEKLEMPVVLENDVADTPHAAQFPSYRIETFAVDAEEGGARRMLHAYLATITYMDAQLGRVLDAFEKRDDADNTVIILWSDHGWHLGEKQCWKKFTLWNEATRNPLMMCGLPMPESWLDGRSLVPLLKNPKADWEWPAITCNGRDSFSLTFEQWKYNRFFDGSEELYNHSKDPLEHTNLADRPEYAELKTRFAKYLPKQSHPNVSNGKEWILWRQDYPPLEAWSEAVEELDKEFAENGYVNRNAFSSRIRKAMGVDDAK